MGDLENDEQNLILQSYSKAEKLNELRVQSIKIAHHGSINGTNPDLLSVVTPESAVISVGKDNQYGHPHAQTLELLQEYSIKVFRTDLLGTIVFNL